MSSCGHRHGRQRMLIEKALGIELEFLEGIVILIVIEVSHGAGLGLPRVPFHLIALQDSPYGIFREDKVVFVLQVCSQSQVPEVSHLHLSNNEALTIRTCLPRRCYGS